MPLILATLNEELKIVRLALDEKTKKHFENLGLTIGSTLTVISSLKSGVIIMVKQGRLALDKDIASKVFVA